MDEEKIMSLVYENPFPIVAMVDLVPPPKNKIKSKYEFYTYNTDLAHVILDELIQENLLDIPWGHTPLKINCQVKVIADTIMCGAMIPLNVCSLETNYNNG